MSIDDAEETRHGPDSFDWTIPVFPTSSAEPTHDADEDDEDDYDEEVNLDDAEVIAEFRWSEPQSWMGGSGGSRLYRIDEGMYRMVCFGDDEQDDETLYESSDTAAISTWASRQDAGAALALELETFDPSAFPDPEDVDEDEPEGEDYSEPHTAGRVEDAFHSAPAGVSLAINEDEREELRAMMSGDRAYERVVSVMRDPLGEQARAFVAAMDDMSLLDFLMANW